jgi:hypothetical protein
VCATSFTAPQLRLHSSGAVRVEAVWYIVHKGNDSLSFSELIPGPVQHKIIVSVEVSGVQLNFKCVLHEAVHITCCFVQYGGTAKVNAMPLL